MEDIAQHTIKATYRAGALILHEPLDLAENSEVELVVLRPQITDSQAKAHLLKIITQRMRRNVWPQQAPKFTREELHARG
jgi:hypothetical protein